MKQFRSLLLAAGLLGLWAPTAMATTPGPAIFVPVGQTVFDSVRSPVYLSDGSQMLLVSVSPPSVTPSVAAPADAGHAVFALARNGIAIGPLPPMAAGESPRAIATVTRNCVSSSGQVAEGCKLPDVLSYMTVQVVATGEQGGIPGAFVVLDPYGGVTPMASNRR